MLLYCETSSDVLLSLKLRMSHYLGRMVNWAWHVISKHTKHDQSISFVMDNRVSNDKSINDNATDSQVVKPHAMQINDGKKAG